MIFLSVLIIVLFLIISIKRSITLENDLKGKFKFEKFCVLLDLLYPVFVCVTEITILIKIIMDGKFI